MADRGTPQEFKDIAAALRGEPQPTKPERDRAVVDALHPEPKEEPEQTEDANVEALLVQRVKPGHAALVRALHPDEAD